VRLRAQPIDERTRGGHRRLHARPRVSQHGSRRTSSSSCRFISDCTAR
jgi:hypothetical protein